MNSDILFQLLLTAAGVALIIVAIEYVVPKIHRAIRRWWISGRWKVPEQIQFRVVRTIAGVQTIETKSGRPVAPRGIHLLVSTESGHEMVSVGAALDRDEFWKTWKFLGGEVGGWIDADTGEEVDLTDL